MSRYIATAAIRGANAIVKEAEEMLARAIAELGPDTPVAFINTAYYLPVILGFTGIEVQKLSDLGPVLQRARALLHPVPEDQNWLPYLGEALDCGVATLLAEEAIEGIRFVRGEQPERIPGLELTGTSAPEASGYANGPIDDIQLRAWGIQLVDGRMPGFAAIVGAAKSNQVAVEIVRQLQQRNILVFLCGNVDGRSIIHQLMEEGVELGYDTYTVPFGTDTLSAIYALGFATRSALTFGGKKGGQTREILLYNKYRVFAFVLALGEVDDLKYATAAGAISYGFPTIADTIIPQVLPTGVTQYEHVVSMPFDDIPGENDLERAKKLVQKCIEVRGVKVKVTEVPIPVPYGSAFEGERVRRADMRIEFGGKNSRCFEYLRMVGLDEVEDGRITVVGPAFDAVEEGGSMDMGIVVEVAGRKMQQDFEPVLERQIHYFINGASGIQHIGQRDIAWIRISKAATEKGFSLEDFGKILHARFHADFGAIVDKVQVTIYTDKEKVEEWLALAREAYNYRNQRLADLTDDAVEEFYSCTLCLPEGEEIVLPDGSFMPVERLMDTVVEERDLSVLTFDRTGLDIRPVEELFINPAPQKLVTIRLANGNSLTLTANHRVLVDTPTGLQWVPAGKLQPGDRLFEGEGPAPATATGPHYIVDLLPDDYRVSDEPFLARLRAGVLAQFGSYVEAARSLEIPYGRLYSALCERTDLPRQRLTLGEVRRIVRAVGWDWDEEKQSLRTFQHGCTLRRVELDEDLLYAAGLVAADGSVRRHGEEGQSGTYVQFSNPEPALVERFCAILSDLFGEPPQRYPLEAKMSQQGDRRIEGERRGEVCYGCHPLFGRLLAGLGIGDSGQEGKWRGDRVSTLPAPLVAAFLRGLFDGDGHVSRQRAFFTTRTYREARHLYLLLKKLGIAAYISQIRRGYQVGTLHGRAFERFRDLISSEHPQKGALLQDTPPQDARHGVRSDVLPLFCSHLLRELVEQARPRGLRVTRLPVNYKTLQAWLAGQRRPSRVKLGQLLDALAGFVDPDDPCYRQLRAWAASDLQLRRVREVIRVDSSDGRVYNFSVAETHNYVVNGIVVQNCQSFAPNHVCVISPERLGLCGAYNWLDCKASFQINPTGPNQPIPKGRCLDPVKGYFDKVNEFVQQTSHSAVQEVSMYSIIENPMTACFTREAEIIVDDRPVAIGDFVDDHIEETFHRAAALTQGPDGHTRPDRIVGMHKNPAPDRLIRLRTRSGNELLLTPNHRIAVDRPEGQVWVRADGVREGDRVYALRHLRLPERQPATIDLLPDDLQVADRAFLDQAKEILQQRFGSPAAACRAASVRQPSAEDHAWLLGDLKVLLAAAGEDWDRLKGQIRQVRIGSSTWTLPELNADLFYLLGLLAADGSLSRRGRDECFVNLVNTDEALLDAVEDLYRRLFPGRRLGRQGKAAGRSQIAGRPSHSRRPGYSLYGANPLLGILADALGVKMAGEGQKDLGRLLSLPQEWVAAFLAGHFDGDGSVRLRRQNGRRPSGEAYLCIEDERTARHLKLLLHRLGLVASLRHAGSVYQLVLHGSSLRRFAEVIPSRHPRKAALLQEIAGLPRRGLSKSLEDVLPYHVGRRLAEALGVATILPPSTRYDYRTARSRPVQDSLRRVLGVRPELAPEFEPFLESDTFLDPVVQVEAVANDQEHDFVYNLTLMDIHSYYANGVWVKNCGCFECIAMLIPEANGIMVVSREDPSMTPAGMTFSTLAGMAGGGLQTPGVMGVGKYYLLSKKFISADGGFKRVVWMSSFLKETMAEELKEVAIREGDPDLIDKIADERVATTVEELLAYLEEKEHPALTLPPIF